MTQAEIEQAMNVVDTDPQRTAIMQLLEAKIDEVLSQLSVPAVCGDHGSLAHLQGAYTWLKDFRDDLITNYNAAKDKLDGEKLSDKNGGAY